MKNLILTLFLFVSTLLFSCKSNQPTQMNFSSSTDTACECKWIEKKNCTKGTCDHKFKCSITGKIEWHAGTKSRAKQLCEIDCCN